MAFFDNGLPLDIKIPGTIYNKSSTPTFESYPSPIDEEKKFGMYGYIDTATNLIKTRVSANATASNIAATTGVLAYSYADYFYNMSKNMPTGVNIDPLDYMKYAAKRSAYLFWGAGVICWVYAKGGTTPIEVGSSLESDADGFLIKGNDTTTNTQVAIALQATDAAGGAIIKVRLIR